MKTVMWITAALPALLLGGQDSAPHSLVAAERAFARAAVERRVNDAFLDVLADSGIIFRPQPVAARAALTERPMAGSLSLVWAPVYAETSADGLLGFDFGPFEAGERGQPATGTGYFLSVWQRAGTASPWRLAADCGAGGPIGIRPAQAATHLRVHALARRFASGDTLADVDAAMNGNFAREFAERAAADVRVLRSGWSIAHGRDEALRLTNRDAPVAMTALRTVVAGSGDLGYTIGEVRADSAGVAGYQRIYRRAADGRWRLAAECRSSPR